jgi:hypothetical protein
MEEPSAAAVESREERAETTVASQDAYAVSDADIQALLAEAESLDAAAVPAAAEEETVSLDAMALGIEDSLSAVAEIEPPAPAVSYTSVTEPISVDLDLDTPPGGIAIPPSAVEAVSEAGFELTAPVAEAAVEAEELFEAALEVAAPILEAALEIEQPMLVEVEEPAEAALVKKEEPAPAALAKDEPVVAAQAEPEAVPEAEVAVVSEIEVAPAIEAVAAAEVVELAAVAAAEVVSIEVGRTAAQSPLPALERFLTKVQARRAQLMAESVA